MKKLLLLAIASTLNVGVWASSNCLKLANIAEANASNYGDDATALIEGKKGDRIYIHIAPSAQCKSRVFIIPNDKVTILQDVISNGESWAYISYINNKTSKLTQGWIKKKNLGEMTFN